MEEIFSALEIEREFSRRPVGQLLRKEARPADEEHRHEPMAQLEHVIDEIAVLRSVGKYPESFIDAEHNFF